MKKITKNLQTILWSLVPYRVTSEDDKPETKKFVSQNKFAGSFNIAYSILLTALLPIYLVGSLVFETFNPSKWAEIEHKRIVKGIESKFSEIDADSSGLIDSTEFLNYNLRVNHGIKSNSQIHSQLREPISVKVGDDKTTVSYSGVFFGYSLIDEDNDGILDMKNMYVSSPRFGQGKGRLEGQITERDRQLYSEVYNKINQ